MKGDKKMAAKKKKKESTIWSKREPTSLKDLYGERTRQSKATEVTKPKGYRGAVKKATTGFDWGFGGKKKK